MLIPINMPSATHLWYRFDIPIILSHPSKLTFPGGTQRAYYDGHYFNSFTLPNTCNISFQILIFFYFLLFLDVYSCVKRESNIQNQACSIFFFQHNNIGFVMLKRVVGLDPKIPNNFIMSYSSTACGSWLYHFASLSKSYRLAELPVDYLCHLIVSPKPVLVLSKHLTFRQNMADWFLSLPTHPYTQQI